METSAITCLFVFKEMIMKQDETRRESTERPEVRSKKFRFGAPDGPRRKRRCWYDGHEPLPYAGHEAIAQFLAAPTADRRFESLTAPVNHFKIARMTLHRWKQNPDVLRRADWLSMHNKKVGDLEIRRQWSEIVAKMIEMAKNGNIAAIRMCLDCAFEEEKQAKKSPLSSESTGDLLARAEEEYKRNHELMTPSWLRERAAREAAKNKAAEESRASGEPKDPPE
jgi:hypothetical protein